jgi:hypothetical protein
MFICAAFCAVVAVGILISGLHPRWRATASWRRSLPRSLFGTLAFSFGLLILGAGLVVRGVLDQHGPFTGAAGRLFVGGGAVLLLGMFYDEIRSFRRR